MNLTELKEVCRRVSKTVVSEDGSFRLDYVLTRISTAEEHGDIFSVTVILTTDSGTEEKTAYDITRREERAMELFRMLSDNGVMPGTLVEVLSELL